MSVISQTKTSVRGQAHKLTENTEKRALKENIVSSLLYILVIFYFCPFCLFVNLYDYGLIS